MKKYLCLLFALIVLGSFYRLGWLRCPFLLLTGLPCPTCGVTRALDALLHGDLAGYWQCHPLALPLAAVVLLFPFRSAGGPFCQKMLLEHSVH